MRTRSLAQGYYGLAPGKEVGLKYAYNFTCTDVVRESGQVVGLAPSRRAWVGNALPVTVERDYVR